MKMASNSKSGNEFMTAKFASFTAYSRSVCETIGRAVEDIQINSILELTKADKNVQNQTPGNKKKVSDYPTNLIVLP
jgi:hypothetical protein